jgi:predicted enzyme related to lactoylglutathione lyase
MERLHVHVAVSDIPRTISFYSALFAAAPAPTASACCTS